jgi:hypothetical protein
VDGGTVSRLGPFLVSEGFSMRRFLVGLCLLVWFGHVVAYGTAATATVYTVNSSGFVGTGSSASEAALSWLNQYSASAGAAFCAGQNHNEVCQSYGTNSCHAGSGSNVICGGMSWIVCPATTWPNCNIGISPGYNNTPSSATGPVSHAHMQAGGFSGPFGKGGTGTSAPVCDKGYRPTGTGANLCQPYDCPAGAVSFANSGFGPYTNFDTGAALATKAYCLGSNGGGGGANYQGCLMVHTPASAKCSSDGLCWSVGGDVMNGQYCEDGATPPQGVAAELQAPPAPPCAAGTCPGTVNGVSVCVACNKTAVQGPSQSASSPNGAASAPGLGSDAPPGTVGTGQRTECDSLGNCTTTTTYYGPNGTVLGTKQTGDSKDNFCKSNPSVSICLQSSVGGSCGATTCTGDAIQCAMITEIRSRDCQFYDDTGSHAQVATQAIAAGLRPSDHPAANPTIVDVGGSISVADTFGVDGGCMADYSFSLAGNSLSVPFSALCGPLGWVGAAGQAVSLVIALFVAFKQ